MNCWVLPVEVTINFSLVQTVRCLCEILPRNRHIFLSITAWLYFNKLFSHLTPPARDSDNNVGNNPRCWPNTCQGLRSVSTDFSRVWDQSLVWTSQKASSGDAEQNYFSGDAAEAEGKENVADLGATDITQTSRCTGPMVAPGHRSPPAAWQGEQFANMHCVCMILGWQKHLRSQAQGGESSHTDTEHLQGWKHNGSQQWLRACGWWGKLEADKKRGKKASVWCI